jgi:hypothetical protein
MERVKTWLLVGAGLVILAFTVSLTDPGRVAADSANFIQKVVFTDITGVPVGNSVVAVQNGTWNVTFTAVPKVAIDQTTSGANGVSLVGSSVTHVGQPASNLVTLVGGGPIAYFARVDADSFVDPPCAISGASPSCFYTPPPHQALVVTDCTWVVAGFGSNALESMTVTLTFGGIPIVPSVNVINSAAMSDAFGRAGATVHLTSGVVVKPGNFLVANFVNPGGNVSASVTLSGYLVADQ